MASSASSASSVDKKRETFLLAYEATRSVPKAAEQAGVDRATPHKWRKEDPEFAETMDAVGQIRREDVEDKLYNEAMAGNVTAMIFFLKGEGPEKWGDKLRHEEREKIRREAEQRVRDELFAEMRGLPVKLRKALMGAIDAHAA